MLLPLLCLLRFVTSKIERVRFRLGSSRCTDLQEREVCVQRRELEVRKSTYGIGAAYGKAVRLSGCVTECLRFWSSSIRLDRVQWHLCCLSELETKVPAMERWSPQSERSALSGPIFLEVLLYFVRRTRLNLF